MNVPTRSISCVTTTTISSYALAKPASNPNPIKRAAGSSAKMGGDNKRSRVALKSRVVSNDKVSAGLVCEEESSTVDTKNTADGMPTQPECTETMEYLEQLYKRLHTTEAAGTQDSGPNARNPKISSSWHRQLVEWMLNFPRDADVQNSTIAVAVVFMQKFLTDQNVAKQWLQLLAMVCTFVASKVNETYSGKSVTMRFLTQFVANQRYSANHIKIVERELLQALKWDLHPVTVHALTMVMLELHPDKTQRAKIRKVANVLLDMQLPNKDFLKWSTKTLALGCLSAACAIAGFTKVYKDILLRISHLVDHESAVESEQLNVILTRMFYTIFPERKQPETRSSSPASIMDPITTNS